MRCWLQVVLQRALQEKRGLVCKNGYPSVPTPSIKFLSGPHWPPFCPPSLISWFACRKSRSLPPPRLHFPPSLPTFSPPSFCTCSKSRRPILTRATLPNLPSQHSQNFPTHPLLPSLASPVGSPGTPPPPCPQFPSSLLRFPKIFPPSYLLPRSPAKSPGNLAPPCFQTFILPSHIPQKPPPPLPVARLEEVPVPRLHHVLLAGRRNLPAPPSRAQATSTCQQLAVYSKGCG